MEMLYFHCMACSFQVYRKSWFLYIDFASFLLAFAPPCFTQQAVTVAKPGGGARLEARPPDARQQLTL